MDCHIYGVAFLLLLCRTSALPDNPLPRTALSSTTAGTSSSGTSTGINSNSVLVALLDSHYTELAELVEKALLLQTLEDVVGHHNITILAPRNEAIDRLVDPEFKQFLLEPRNLPSLQSILLYHIIPSRLHSRTLSQQASHLTLTGEQLQLPAGSLSDPNVILRPDGVIHGINQLLIPRSVQQDYNRHRSLADISAVLPTGAPDVDPRTHRLKKLAPPVPLGAPPVLPIYVAMAPGLNLSPAPAPGPGSGKHHFDGHNQVKDFIQTLLLYGGYNELADILVNLTSLATEMGRLVSEGYVLTVLAPNDEAMAKLTTDQLSEPGAPEQIMYYHMIPEYQTEESMYNAVRRFGKIKYDTLRLPHKVVAKEADGSVKFGSGEGSAYLFDPDIYTDGRISVQGIDAVLFPPEENVPAAEVMPADKKPSTVTRHTKLRRGKLLETACKLLGAFGHSRFITCQ
ncbi:Fasciclin-like arabinogalactan protein 15 [Rhynchospora pubera]|uniref:Fasciclin-like arabinogalactan protein 15 n=1 Tax=Rhynchospora pubera TaxID=906938 RepID=A0AAV8CTI6_9POAL|nr:Fasciclin-like arabinogalactan protein 15 [Rhynchospora pubera]